MSLTIRRYHLLSFIFLISDFIVLSKLHSPRLPHLYICSRRTQARVESLRSCRALVYAIFHRCDPPLDFIAYSAFLLPACRSSGARGLHLLLLLAMLLPPAREPGQCLQEGSRRCGTERSCPVLGSPEPALSTRPPCLRPGSCLSSRGFWRTDCLMAASERLGSHSCHFLFDFFQSVIAFICKLTSSILPSCMREAEELKTVVLK